MKKKVDSKRKLFEMMNKLNGNPLLSENKEAKKILKEYDNYNYPAGADGPDAPWNQEDSPEVDTWDIYDEDRIHFKSDTGLSSLVDIVNIIDNSTEDENILIWFSNNYQNPEFEAKLKPYVDKYINDDLVVFDNDAMGEGTVNVSNDSGEPMGTEYQNDSLDNDMYGDGTNMKNGRTSSEFNNINWQHIYNDLVKNTREISVNGGDTEIIMLSDKFLDIMRNSPDTTNWGIWSDGNIYYFDLPEGQNIPDFQEFLKTMNDKYNKYF